MKTLFVSYLTSVLAIIFLSLPAVEAAPLDVIPRICFYYGLPLAVFVSLIIMTLLHLVGCPGHARDSELRVAEQAKGTSLIESKGAA